MKLSKNTQKQQIEVLLKNAICESKTNGQMFDYQNKNQQKRKYKITQSCDIYSFDKTQKSKKNEIQIVKTGSYNKNQYLGRIDFNISKNQSYYRFVEKACLVERGEGITLKQGSIFKIGRIKLKIVHINQLFNKDKNHLKCEWTQNKNILITSRNAQKGVCKFCLTQNGEEGDQLISPCNCRGSCQNVHLSCLKMWLTQKLKRHSTKNSDYYDFQQLKCQICHCQLPISVQIKGKTNDLIGIQYPECNFIAMEAISCNNNSTQDKPYSSIIVAKFMKNISELKIGRGNQCDIRLNDISVSRLHAVISLTKESGVVIKDCESKFGTLVEMTKNIVIGTKQFKIQIGDHCLEFSQKNKLQDKQNQ